MKRFLILIFAASICILSHPKKLRLRHKTNNVHVVSNHMDTVNKKNYSIIIEYLDSIPKFWHLESKDHSCQFEYDPREVPVYFNPKAPKYFHSKFDCKKIGEFRKLDKMPIEKFLKANKSAFLCPQCAAKDQNFFLISQILLDE